MHEGIAWCALIVPPREAAVLRDERVSEFTQNSPCVLNRVGSLNAVMQVNLYLSPSITTMLCEAFDERLVILLGWRKVGVTKREAVRVAQGVKHLRIHAAPLFKPSLLFIQFGVPVRRLRQIRWLEVVCQRDDEMHDVAARSAARQSLIDVSGQPAQAAKCF